MRELDDEDALLRSVALQNANSILLARQRAEEELLRTREALRESQERLTAALTAAGTGTFRWNMHTNTVEWDGNLDRLFGLESDRATQSLDAFIGAVHPDDRPAVVVGCERCAREGSDFDMEFRVVWPDGSVHWIDDKAKAFRRRRRQIRLHDGRLRGHHQPQGSRRGAARERGAPARDLQPGRGRDRGRGPRRPLPRHEPQVLGHAGLQRRRAPARRSDGDHPPGRSRRDSNRSAPAARGRHP